MLFKPEGYNSANSLQNTLAKFSLQGWGIEMKVKLSKEQE